MGIDTRRFQALANQSPVREKTILFLGRLVPIKGVDVLLAAIDHLQQRSAAPVKLIIAGDGPSRSALERRASRIERADIQFTGEVRGRCRDRLLSAADIIVLSSRPTRDGRTEGTPVTALEAMATGVPVIASRTGGLAELPPSTVSFVPPDNPIILARAIHRLQHDSGRRTGQITAAHRHVDQLDWEHVGARLWPQSIDPTI